MAQTDGTYGVKLNTDYKDTITKVIVPSEYNGKPVTTIIESGFSNAVALLEIELPNTITKINEYAFNGCNSLESINNNLEKVTSLGVRAFCNCYSLDQEIIFSDSLSSIPKYAFYNCSSITTITIPANVKSILDSAFRNSGLTSATFLDTEGWEYCYNNEVIGPTYYDADMSDPSKAANLLKSNASSSGYYAKFYNS